MIPPATGLIVVTGASSGIGRAAALSLGSHDHTLLLVARREAPLADLAQQLRPDRSLICPCDITSASDRARLLSCVRASNLPLIGLINAAGIVHRSTIEHTSQDDLERLFATNALAPAHLIASFWPDLRSAAASGLTPRIINIASLAVVSPLDGLFAYAASKFALAGLTVASAQQAARDGIISLCLCPGSTETPMLRSVAGTDEIPVDQTMPASAMGTLIARAIAGDLDQHHGKALPIIPQAQQAWWKSFRTHSDTQGDWLSVDEAIFL